MDSLERRVSELPLPSPTRDLSERMQPLIQSLNQDSRLEQGVPGRLTVGPRWRSKRPFGSAVVLTAVVLTLVMATWPRGSSQALAFDDVVESARLVRTVQYIFKRVYFTELPAGGLPVQSTENGDYKFETDMREVAERQARILEGQFVRAVTEAERRELSQRIDLLRSHTEPEQPQLEHAVRVRAAIGGLERREPIFPPSGVSISNAQTGKNVTFDHFRRKMFVIRHQMQESRNGEPVSIDHIQTDVITQLISIPKSDVVRLNDKRLSGRLVSGFRRIRGLNGGTVQQDYWIDPATRLPVLIEKRLFEMGSSKPAVYSVYSDFVFDQPLESSLFSTELPDGYQVDQATVTFLSEANGQDDQ